MVLCHFCCVHLHTYMYLYRSDTFGILNTQQADKHQRTEKKKTKTYRNKIRLRSISALNVLQAYMHILSLYSQTSHSHILIVHANDGRLAIDSILFFCLLLVCTASIFLNNHLFHSIHFRSFVRELAIYVLMLANLTFIIFDCTQIIEWPKER